MILSHAMTRRPVLFDLLSPNAAGGSPLRSATAGFVRGECRRVYKVAGSNPAGSARLRDASAAAGP